MEDIGFIIIMLLYAVTPIISLIAVGVCIFRLVKAKKGQKASPLVYTDREISSRKHALIAASIVAGVLISIHIGITILMGIALSHM